MSCLCGKTKVFPDPDGYETSFQGKILVIGAGVAGMTAGYLLKQKEVDFEIIEASSCWGGRIKDDDDFCDFPIARGAEWVHAPVPYVGIHNAYCPVFEELTKNQDRDTPLFEDIIQDVNVATSGKAKLLGKWSFERKIFNLGGDFKFHGSSWVKVFEKKILPSIKDKIIYDSPVAEISYEKAKVVVKTKTGATYEADKVFVAVPVWLLQRKDIAFTPPLPADKVACLDKQVMLPGVKMFFEFKEKFYPHMLMMKPFSAGGVFHMYFDDSVGKETQKHIMCCVLAGNENYAEATKNGDSDENLKDFAMKELDGMFDSKASKNLISYIIQNWTTEEYIWGGLPDCGNKHFDPVKLAKPVAGKVFFGGDAFNPVKHNNEYVQGACETSYIAVKAMLSGKRLETE